MNKIKSSDLRIGNWVMVCHDKHAGWFNVRVTATHLDNTIDTDFNDKDVKRYFYEPIPLTDEILSKTNLLKLIGKWYYKDVYLYNENRVDFQIFIRSGNEGAEFFLKRINYLHELQNAIFFLLNEELEVKL